MEMTTPSAAPPAARAAACWERRRMVARWAIELGQRRKPLELKRV